MDLICFTICTLLPNVRVLSPSGGRALIVESAGLVEAPLRREQLAQRDVGAPVARVEGQGLARELLGLGLEPGLDLVGGGARGCPPARAGLVLVLNGRGSGRREKEERG